MHSHRNLRAMLVSAVLAGSLSLFGCGGGGTTTAPAAGSGGMISGRAVKGPVGGATVTAYAVSNGTMGVQLASGTTDSTGSFSMQIGSYTGPLVLQMGGGTYVDEATGATTTMAPGDVMTAVISSMASGATVTGIQVTPLTSMAQAMAENMTGGLTDADIASADAAVGNYFMVSDILHTVPVNPLETNSGAGATQDMKNYGMALAAVSQYAKSIGMTSPSAMVTALVNDASDGVLNGMMGGAQIAMGGGMMSGTMMQATAGTGGLATAMTQFMGSTANKSGLAATDVQALINQLNASSGTL